MSNQQNAKTQKAFIVGDKYKIKRRIGCGSFGEVFSACDIATGEEVAIKLEQIRTHHPQLASEHYVYQQLGHAIGIPRVHMFITQHGYNCLVMDYLGPSLEELFNFCARRFSLKTVLMLVEEMLARVQYVHAREFIHRDVKPDNFLCGIGQNCNKLYLVDFGLAKSYCNPTTKQHVPYRDGKNLIGTARYASINTHTGIEQARRDDLESLGYVWLYFLRGQLPWQGLKAANRQQRYQKIAEKKMSITVDELCIGFPHQFSDYLKYCRALRFDEPPNIDFWIMTFRYLRIAMKLPHDFCFDWTLLRQNATLNKVASGSNLATSLLVENPTTAGGFR